MRKVVYCADICTCQLGVGNYAQINVAIILRRNFFSSSSSAHKTRECLFICKKGKFFSVGPSPPSFFPELPISTRLQHAKFQGEKKTMPVQHSQTLKQSTSQEKALKKHARFANFAYETRQLATLPPFLPFLPPPPVSVINHDVERTGDRKAEAREEKENTGFQNAWGDEKKKICLVIIMTGLQKKYERKEFLLPPPFAKKICILAYECLKGPSSSSWLLVL